MLRPLLFKVIFLYFLTISCSSDRSLPLLQQSPFLELCVPASALVQGPSDAQQVPCLRIALPTETTYEPWRQELADGIRCYTTLDLAYHQGTSPLQIDKDRLTAEA